MGKKNQAATELVSFRTEPGTAERAEWIAEELHERAVFRGFSVTRSRVMNLALLRGLDLLEEEHGLKRRRRRKG